MQGNKNSSLYLFQVIFLRDAWHRFITKTFVIFPFNYRGRTVTQHGYRSGSSAHCVCYFTSKGFVQKKKKIMISEVKILLGKASDDFTSKVPPWKGNLRLLKSGQDLVTSTLNTFPLEHIFGKLACWKWGNNLLARNNGQPLTSLISLCQAFFHFIINLRIQQKANDPFNRWHIQQITLPFQARTYLTGLKTSKSTNTPNTDFTMSLDTSICTEQRKMIDETLLTALLGKKKK